VGPRLFATPDAAAKALVEALAANDDAALRSLVGPGNEDLVPDGRDATVKSERASIAAAAKQKVVVSRPRPEEAVAVLEIGPRGWPFPIPLVQQAGGWRFDAAEGRLEVRARRMEANVSRALAFCRAYVGAQKAYAREDRDGDGVPEYAQRFVSQPGQKDGLYWDTLAGEPPSPLPVKVPSIRDLTTGSLREAPPGGYVWRILTEPWLVGGNLTRGFGLLGIPYRYGETGVLTILAGPDGRVYVRDFGPSTLETVRGWTGWVLDDGWDEATPP
jgi:hypothetical protein